jgi:hypothetical protein
MAPKPEKPKHYRFYILNIKLRKKGSNKEASVDEYINLLKRLYNKKIHTESSPSKHCILRFLFEEKDSDKIIYLSGSFAQFTYIQNERWFNLDSLDIDKEFKVPDGLFPDAVSTEYIFIPSAHRFCFRTHANLSISPYPVRKFLEKALDSVCSADDYVQVDVETDVSTIEMIFNAKEIRKLYININYSNLDTGSSFKEFVENDIKSSNTSQIKIQATPKPDGSIDIDKSTILKGALESSASDGEAEAVIIDQNDVRKKIKTTDFPRKEEVFGNFARFNYLVYEKVISIFRSNGN